MDGQEIFERTAEKYADCRTYIDAGRIENGQTVISFKTFFIRPNMFKYEFNRESGDGASGVIWSDGNEYFSSYNHEIDHVPYDHYSSLLLAMATASTEASYLVPMMLMPDYAGSNSLNHGVPYKSAEHTSIADRSCWRIRATNAELTFKADLLIDSLGYKIRKIILEDGPESTYQVTFNESSFDRDINEDIFNLKHD